MSDIISVHSMKTRGLRQLFFLVVLLSCSLGRPNGSPGLDLTPTVPREPKCVCVKFYLCRNNTLNTDGRGIIKPTIRLRSCQNLGEVCCPASNQLPPTTTTTTTTEKPTSKIMSTAKPATTVKTTETSGPVQTGRKRPLGCGYRNPDGIGHRIGGGDENNTEFAEFPWMVAVLMKDEDDNGNPIITYKCGGSLIHPEVVLTAAHCVVATKRGKRFKIRAGEWDMISEDETIPYQDRDVASVLMHSGYRSGSRHNNIALLFLETPLDTADNIDFACLAPRGTTLTNINCWASGWGRGVFDDKETMSTTLKKVELPMVPHQKCQEALRKNRLGPAYNLHSSFVCAGGQPGKDTCQGDGGSPLVCPIPGTNERYQQIGIVSWGISCGNESIPGVYTNVADLRAWIDENMAKKQLGTKIYTY